MTGFFTPTTLASYLNISIQTIYNRLNTKGSLPVCTRIGRLVRFSATDVEDWLEEQREGPPGEDIEVEVPVLPPRRRGRPAKQDYPRKAIKSEN